jgi:hypothetical protein
LLLSAILALFTAACTNPALTERENAGKGVALVSLSGMPSSGDNAAVDGVNVRSVIPALNQDDFGYMLYAETDAANLENVALLLNPKSAFPLELDPAHWTIRVKAWEGSVPQSPDSNVPAFAGSAELDVSAGQTTPLTIALRPVQLYQETEAIGSNKILTPTRFGTFAYSVTFTYDESAATYPGDLNYAQLYVYPLGAPLCYKQPIEGEAVPLEDGAVYPIKGAQTPLEEGAPIMIIDLLQNAQAEDNDKKVEAAVELPVGFYRIATQLNRTDSATQKYAGDTEVIAVYKDKTAAYSAAYAPGAFWVLMETEIPSLPPPFNQPVSMTGRNIFSEIWGTGDSVQNFLAKKPQNTRDTPYLIGISGANAKLDGTGTVGTSQIGAANDPLANLFTVLQGRYVIYDLSQCTGASIPDIANSVFLNSRIYADRVVGVILPATIATIGNHAFSGCSSLTQVTLPGNLTTINASAFSGCSSLTQITLPESLTTLSANAFYGCSSLTQMTLPESLTTLSANAFSGCASLAQITLPESLTTLGANVFSGCSSLAQITLPSTWTSIGANALSGCALEQIILPSGITAIGNSAFANCTALAQITLHEGIVSIGNSAFSNCTALAQITLPESLTTLGTNVFSGCSSLAQITLPSNWTSIGANALSGCALEQIALPSGITAIGNSAFANCTALAQITLHEGIISIGNSAFTYCSSLESLVLPASVTTLGTTAFRYCSALASVDIPGGIAEITVNTFGNCSALLSVTLRKSDGVVTLANVNAFGNTNYATNPDFAIYVPAGQLENYKAAAGNWTTLNTNWKNGTGNTDGSIFRAIP